MTHRHPFAPVEPPGLDALPTKAARIRALADAGFARADIARRLDIRYQHVRNVLEREPESASRGVREDQASFEADRPYRLKVGADGRIVIPAAIRIRMGLGDDAVLLARLEDDELRLITPDAALRRTQELIDIYVPEGVSLVDELIADRRREAERE